MVKLCSLLEPFDILSPSPSLYSKGQKHFITYSGIIISLVIYAFFLILILYFMIDFINGSGVSIIYSKDEVSENFNLNLKLSLYNNAIGYSNDYCLKSEKMQVNI